MKRIYLDNAATTKMDKRVAEAMKPFFIEVYGNPGSLHWFGQEASAAVFNSREKIARALGCGYKEIVFTGSATEANNLALRGVIQESKKARKQESKAFRPKIITSVIEHESVLETCHALESEGVEVVYLPVLNTGVVDISKLESLLDERTVLVSVMYVNNETGVTQPIKDISAIIQEFRRSSVADHPSLGIYPLFHTDAVQAFQFLPCKIEELGVDLLTLSAHKIYGPKGVGALYVRGPKTDVRKNIGLRSSDIGLLAPVITGSGQERGLRSGTENVPYIVGMGEATELVENSCAKERKRMEKLRDDFVAKILKIFPEAEINGAEAERVPNIMNVYFPKRDAGDLLIAMDVKGVAASPGAACRSRAAKESYVLLEMGFSKERASESLRFSFGRFTSKKDTDAAFKVLKDVLEK